MEFTPYLVTFTSFPPFFLEYLFRYPPSFFPSIASFLGIDGLAMLIGWRSLWTQILYQSHYMYELFGEGGGGSVLDFNHIHPSYPSYLEVHDFLFWRPSIPCMTFVFDSLFAGVDFLPRLPCCNPIIPCFLEILLLRPSLTSFLDFLA